MVHYEIQELITEIQQGRCVLFLGAGSTMACESPSGGGVTGEGLAQSMVKSLGEDPTNFNATLMEASEFIEAHSARHRSELDQFIYERLHDLRPTIGHLLISLFPWQAIITTNYNRVIEAGYDVAATSGITKHSVVPFRTDEDLRVQALGANQVALFKPHGCLSVRGNPNSPMVLTAKDYYHSTKKREKMYEKVKQLAGNFSTLFIGYSLVDYNFNNIYYELQETLGVHGYLARSYSVIPVPSHKSRYLQRVYQRRDITLIDDKFDTFMIALANEAGLLTGTAADVTVDELSRPSVVQRLGVYAGELPAPIIDELKKKGVTIP